jgi:hypothetical protein
MPMFLHLQQIFHVNLLWKHQKYLSNDEEANTVYSWASTNFMFMFIPILIVD